jgi:hypothetical protein
MKKWFISSLILLSLLLSGLSACAAEEPDLPEETATPELPTEEPTATIDWFPRTPTATPNLFPSPTVTKAPSATPESLDMLASDDFSDDSLWQTSSNSAGTIAYAKNALSLAVSGGKNSLVSLSSHDLPSDFYLEINLDAQMCSDADQFGVILWNNSSSGTFRVWFSCDGRAMVDRLIAGEATILKRWEPLRRFQPGSPAKNRIGIRSENNSITVFVNDTEQFTYSPLNKLTGPLGVIAQSSGDLPLTVHISDLQIQKP